ncbi:MAG: RNA helicase, partial [Acetobacteraceae bacterium]|nr:RNA helicase [Acetobacteraceae bacterium]
RGLLAKLLRGEGVDRVLVFARTKHGADKVVKQLAQDGLSANAIHGNKSQGQRERALMEFKTGRAPILVATDIAARGIDVDGVTHVVQYDLPDVPESYVHRIGRTARAGASGEAVALVAPDETDKLRAVEKLIRQSIPAEDLRQDKSAPLNRPQQAGGGGGRQRQGQRARNGRGGGGGSGQQRPWSGQQQGPGNRRHGGGGAPLGSDAVRRRAAPVDAAPARQDRQRWRDADFRDSAPEPRGGGSARQAAR